MKMTTRVAFENMKYHRSKNILIGIAVALTTFLLFVIPAVGNGMIQTQYSATNRVYPTWHALFRNVDERTAEKLAAHYDVAEHGLRCDLGMMKLEHTEVSMINMDESGAKLYKVSLLNGHFPEKEDEIVVSKGILDALGQTGEIGDTITVPYQVYRDGALDYMQERPFKICGFLEDNDSNRELDKYMSLISMALIEREIPADQIAYRFLFQIRDLNVKTTDGVEAVIKNLAGQFGIRENDMNINEDYLSANYVDPSFIPAIGFVMLIVVIAGIITIYSIYYVSMNQRIQELGRLGAIGATRRQMKQIVLREGLCVAVIAVPVGLLLGTFVSRFVLLGLFRYANVEHNSEYLEVLRDVITNGEVCLCLPWIYALAAAISLGTVYVSLAKPMRLAAKLSQTEAIRFREAAKRRKSARKGYHDLTIGRLTGRNLSDNKKKSAVTIFSMAATGMLLMIVATIVSCANPRESADNSILGQYAVAPVIEEGNREHPEREWSSIQKNNPMTEQLRKEIEQLDGVERVDVSSSVMVKDGMFGEDFQMIGGIPEEYAGELEEGIREGKATYEELKAGDKIIIDRTLRHWYPELEVGKKLTLSVCDGDETYEKEFEIAAIGEYSHALMQYRYILTAKEAADRLCKTDCTEFFHIYANQDYDPALEQSLKELIAPTGTLQMGTWKSEYEEWKSVMVVMSIGCYAFLGILAVISVMNLVNTMINSVYTRKKEIGMMQAIGMSDRQLLRMLQMEGLFYTLGTLLLSVGLGSLIGYPIYVYARTQGLFQIRNYHYPFAAAIIVSVALIVIQLVLALVIARSVRRDPIIERIRFSE